MNIMIVGSGAREHAILDAVEKSPKVEKIYCVPGNGGICERAICENIDILNPNKMVSYAKEKSIDLVIVGPEAPLVDGLADEMEKAGILVFGPKERGARLEGSKRYMKDFLKKYDIPTARYESFHQFEAAKEALSRFRPPYVIKTSGLAAGKGVIIAESQAEAEKALYQMMEERAFGMAGSEVVIEEFLEGVEMSLLCFVDGQTIVPMESAQDYKRALDGDKGLNTGGMGCFSPHPRMDEAYRKQIAHEILSPTLKGLREEQMDYCGVLFVGLMCTEEGPKVLEYNVRFGDPETEVVLPRLESDLIDIMMACTQGKLQNQHIAWSKKACVSVICASDGYPGKYEKGKEITGLAQVEGARVYHAGTIKISDRYYTSGGRVLAVSALCENLEKAREKAYREVAKIAFQGIHYRRDIGKI